MKAYLISLFFLLVISFSLYGQTFNNRWHFDFPAAVLTNVMVGDSGYYAVGIIADSIFPYKTGNLFLKLDLEGNILFHKTLRDTAKTYEIWLPTLIQTSDNNLTAVGYTSDTTSHSLILKYNLAGDTLWSRQHLSPFHPQEPFMSSYGMVETPDSGLVVVNWVRNTSGASNGDISVYRTDSIGNILWHNNYGDQLFDQPSCIVKKLDSDHYIIGSHKMNDNQVDFNYTSRTHIFQIDGQGQLMWNYFSPIDQLRSGANSILLTEDGGMVVVGQKGVEEMINPAAAALYWESGLMFKLNENRFLEWEVEFRDPPRRTQFNKLSKVIGTTDNSGYVAVGNYSEIYEDFTSDRHGWIVKASPEGDSLWSRKLNVLDEINTQHELYDIKETTDGGFIIVGQAKSNVVNYQSQQAWIIKVDEYGCLVPNCHLSTDTEEAEKRGFDLKLYPNPSSEFLSIFYSSPSYQNGSFRIINTNGQILKSFPHHQKEITYLLDVKSWNSGTYFLQYFEDDKLLETQTFIVQH